MRRDISVHIKKVCQFMVDNVTIARDAIYRLAVGIRSKTVEDLLKKFSGVPTMVRPAHLSCRVILLT